LQLQPYPVAGPPGPPGPTGSGVYSRIAAQAVGGHRVVRSVSATQVDYADVLAAEHADDVLGLALNAAAIGDAVNVVRMGDVTEPSWAWLQGQSVLLGTNGQLTQSPVAGAAFFQIIGHATSPTSIFVDIQTAILQI
jgi:hypothetical protein